MKAKIRRRFLILAFLMSVSGAVIVLLNGPFIFVALCFTIGLVAAIASTRRRRVQLVLVHAAAVVAALTATEAIFALREYATNRTNYQQVNSLNNLVPHSTLRYTPRPNSSRQVKKYYRGTLLYDTTYTIDKNGLRTSPQPDVKRAAANLLFFGGSFTFGDGVGDGYAMPYVVGTIGDGSYRVLNLGFHGYGPQQMLATLEENLVDDLIDRRLPVVGIYQCSFLHVRRAVGLEEWTLGTPRYVLGVDGKIGRAGFFPEAFPPVSALKQLFARSNVYRQTLGDRRPPTRREKVLFVEMVGEAERLLSNRYPGALFYVLYWDQDFWWRDRFILDRLRSRGVAVIPVSSILDVWSDENRISPHDAHPSPLAHNRIAHHVASMLDL